VRWSTLRGQQLMFRATCQTMVHALRRFADIQTSRALG
jgi:hypothetical protein